VILDTMAVEIDRYDLVVCGELHGRAAGRGDAAGCLDGLATLGEPLRAAFDEPLRAARVVAVGGSGA
jgi:hypothetical protein